MSIRPLAVTLVGCLAVLATAVAFADTPPQTKRSKLKEHPPVRCAKTQRVVLSKVSIRGPVAVDAAGGCSVVIRDSEIVGKRMGLSISGGARVVLVNTDVRSPKGVAVSVSGGALLDVQMGEISGRRAYVVSGGGVVRAKNVTVRGRGNKARTAQFKDLGGNRFLPR